MTRTSPRVAHQPAMDDMDEMRVASDSDDDLNITQSVQKDLGHEDYIKSASLFPHPYTISTDRCRLAPRSRTHPDLR